MELWEASTTYSYAEIDWRHIMKLAAAGAGPLAIGYWRKNKALLEPPPEE
jgi:hypothetical protein